MHEPEQRRQILDLQLKHYSGKGRRISIEIDRGNKRISFDKLVRAAELGHLALWSAGAMSTSPSRCRPLFA
jgi:hypothetical protein